MLHRSHTPASPKRAPATRKFKRVYAAIMILLAALASPIALTTGANAQTQKSGIGMNSYANDYYFVNLMKIGTFFQYLTTPIAFDTNGWPTTDCGISFLFSGHYGVSGITGLVNPNISGTYHLSFQCANPNVVVSSQGTSGNSFTISNQAYNAGTQTWSGDLVFTATTGYISPSFVNTSGGIRNVVMIMPGYPANTQQIFTNQFTTMMAPCSVFRPLSDQGNGTYSYPAVRQWAGRINNPNAPSVGQSADGSFLSWEWQIMMANAANSDLWICVPINATDDYVTQLATVLKNGETVDGIVYPPINSNLHVYVEYSNEVWNFGFYQFFWTYPAARDEINKGQSASPMYLPNTNNYSNGSGGASGLLYYSEHAKRCSDLFRNVWGSANMMTRIRPLLMWQSATTGEGDAADFVDQWFGPSNQYFYGSGVATYFNPNGSISTETEPQLIAAAQANITAMNNMDFPIMRTIATEHGLNMDSYEGGTGVSLSNPMTQAEYNQIYDSQMNAITQSFYTDWFANGGDVTNWVGLQGTATPASGGAYGIVEDPNNPSGSPRWLGLQAASAATKPALTAGQAIASSGTTTFDAADYPNCPETTDSRTIGTDQSGNHYVSIGNNSSLYRTYLIRIAAAGNYTISANATTSHTGDQALFTVDGIPAAQPNVPTTGTNPWTATAPFVINLTAGLHSLRITANNNPTDQWNYENFIISAGGTLTTNQKPTAPNVVGAYGENGQNLVVWRQPSNNGSAISTYNLYRATTSDGEGITPYKTGLTVVNTIDTGLANGTTYYYKVTALNANGESAQSSEISAVPTARPGAPTNLTVTVNGGVATLSWTAPAGQVDLYNIYRSEGPGLEPASPYSLNTITSAGTTYADSNNLTSSIYYYKVTAVNMAGEGATSNEAVATMNATRASDPMIYPYVFGAKYLSNGPVTVTIGEGTVGAVVFYTTDGSNPTTSSPVYTGPFTLTSSNWVNAFAAKSGLSNSNQVGSYYTVAPPLPPANVTATPGSGQVTVNWTAASGATSYNVKRATVNGGPYAIVGSPASASFTNTGLAGGTSYYYVVTSVGLSGQSGESYQASATTAGAPPPPTGLSATAGNAQVALSWTASSDATSYNVLRSTVNGSGYASAATGIVPTSYTNTGLTNGTTYYYVVTATNAGGTSGNSNQASATPAASGTGLRGEYYNSVDFTGPIALSRIDSTVDFDWAYGSPGTGVNVDNFSARWTGQVQAPITSNYTFSTTSDDGVRLWVNGVLVINHWDNHPPTVDQSGPISLVAGTKYNIHMEYFEGNQGATAKLHWNYTGQIDQAIPASQLTPGEPQATVATATTAPTIDGNVDAAWGNTPTYSEPNLVGTLPGGATLAATWQAMWDSTNLYVLATVSDSTLIANTDPANGDSVEVYIDGDNNKSTSYDANDWQYIFPWNGTTVEEFSGGHLGSNTTGVTFGQVNITGGYRIEAKIPWSTIGVTPASNNLVGLDFAINNSNVLGTRACKVFWNATVDSDWTNPSLFGTGKLK